MTNWTEIHPDFIKEQYNGKTYQQEWEENGLTYQDAKEWIGTNFAPHNSWVIKCWKDYGFTSQQVKEWIQNGLEWNESDLTFYLKQKGCQPSELTNNKLTQLKKEYYQVQNWLDFWYPVEGSCKIKNDCNDKNFGKTREQIIKLGFWGHLSDNSKKLQGSLKLKDFTNLESFDCRYNQITSLNLTDCVNLKELDCWSNKLTNFDFLKSLKNPEKLRMLDIRENNFSESDLTPLGKFIGLESLYLCDNRFAGSLKPLMALDRLHKLNRVFAG